MIDFDLAKYPHQIDHLCFKFIFYQRKNIFLFHHTKERYDDRVHYIRRITSLAAESNFVFYHLVSIMYERRMTLFQLQHLPDAIS